jgi:hypothetical protein
MPRRLLSALLPTALVAVALVATWTDPGWAKAAKGGPTTTTAAPSPTAAPTTTTTAAPVTTTTAAPATTTTAAPAPTTTSTTTAPSATTSTTVDPATTSTTAAAISTAAATSTTTTSTSTSTSTATSAPTYTSSRTETFPVGWYSAWGLAKPWHTGVISETSGNTFLRAAIVAGTHDGTSFRLPMPNADVAHLRYRVRYGPTFSAAGSANNVKMPGFGNPSLDAAGVCLAGCGLAVADGITAYSARSDLTAAGVPGWYVYDVDAALSLTYGRGERWNFPGFANDRWYTVDQYIRLNTPGLKDGSLSVLIDGVKVFERNTYTFRTVPTLKVGNAWFDVYFGGTGLAPVDMTVDFDDVVMEWG